MEVQGCDKGASDPAGTPVFCLVSALNKLNAWQRTISPVRPWSGSVSYILLKFRSVSEILSMMQGFFFSMGCTQGRLKLQPAASIHSASQFNERYWPALPRRESVQSGSAAVLCSSPKINNPFAGRLHETMHGWAGVVYNSPCWFFISISLKRDQIFCVSDDLVLLLVSLVFLFVPPSYETLQGKGNAAQRQT